MKLFLFLLFSSVNSYAEVKNLSTFEKTSIKDFVTTVKPGDILILGESHAVFDKPNLDQQKQVEIIEELVSVYPNVSVGMEFIDYSKQEYVDLYLKEEISEEVFLNSIQWGGAPFDAYKKQMWVAKKGVGWVYALNAPRALTSYVGKHGMENIPNEISKFLPPDFEEGNPDYKVRFNNEIERMGKYINIDYYFQAQSIWDETMAWNISKIMNEDPSQILVVVVGAFHIQYGGGLPDRIRARGVRSMKTLLQTSSYEPWDKYKLIMQINSDQDVKISDYILD